MSEINIYDGSSWRNVSTKRGGLNSYVTTTYTYQTNGDSNGIISNRINEIIPSASSTSLGFSIYGPLDRSVDSTPSVNWLSNNSPNSWWRCKFPGFFFPSYCTIRSRSDTNSTHPRSFKVQFSNDLITWIDGATVSNDLTLSNVNTYLPISLNTFSYSGYMYARIYSTGVDSSGTNYLSFGEVEFYGTLLEGVLSGTNPLNQNTTTFTQDNQPSSPNIGDIWLAPNEALNTNTTITTSTSKAKIVCLMHFNNSFAEVTGRTVTLGGTNPPSISNVQSRFGNSSAYFDGTGHFNLNKLIPNVLGYSDFTYEVWLYLTANRTDACGLLDFRSSQSVAPSSLIIYPNNYIGYYNTTDYTATTNPLSINTWNHVAFTREGSVFRGFVNGVMCLEIVDSTFTPGNNFLVGALPALTNSQKYIGYMDELRLVKNYAKYTSNFSVPTTSFLDSGADI